MSHVIRIRRAEDPSAFVIVNTQQNGPNPLDLKVVGTDGELPFVTEVKQRSIKKLRSTKNPGTDEEWAVVLSTILLQQDAPPSVVHGLETVASVADDEKYMTISVRKNIGGITQRLGDITLAASEEVLDIVEWAGVAAQAADGMRSQLTQLNQSLSAQQEKIRQLTSQLDALVLAKKEHEEELLKKFAALLNAKKLKIRDQQRLLSKAKIDPKAADEVKQTRSYSPARKAEKSRISKRKANASLPDSATDDEEDFQPTTRGAGMQKAHDSTPEMSEPEETEDETDIDEFDPAPIPSQASRRGASQIGKSTAFTSNSPKRTEATVEELAAQAPPPRRELPFARKDLRSQKPDSRQPSEPSPAPVAPISSSTQAADEDTESDDEL